ncbi:hypothetical protein [Amycolatopsis thermoflava]|nr:hypothetical protein [Amycolatopsis thermoflava]
MPASTAEPPTLVDEEMARRFDTSAGAVVGGMPPCRREVAR